MKALRFSVSVPQFLTLKVLGALFPQLHYRGPLATVRLDEIPEPPLPSSSWVKIRTLLCGFCAPGAAGFRRDMTSAEIVQQACFAAKRLADRGERLSNVVFMGMGEPLLNVPEVSRTIGILLSQFGFGISSKRVTVSTAGVVPEMRTLAHAVPVSFAVSINAARDDLRSRLMPINRKYPLKEVVAAMRRIPLQTGRKVTAEYVLLAGVNDSLEDALALSRLFRGARIKVNLIPYNAHDASPYRAPEAGAVDRFRNVLIAGGIQTITRERRGADIRAACGQLRTVAGGKIG